MIQTLHTTDYIQGSWEQVWLLSIHLLKLTGRVWHILLHGCINVYYCACLRCLHQDVVTKVETMMPIYHFSFMERTEMSEEEITPSGQVTLCPLYHRDHSDNTEQWSEHPHGQTYRVFLAALHHLHHSTRELYWVSIGNSLGKFQKIFLKKDKFRFWWKIYNFGIEKFGNCSL